MKSSQMFFDLLLPRSFRISAPVPLSAEALSLLGDVSAWSRSTNRNVSERPSPSNSPNSGNGMIVKQSSNHQQSVDLCDQLLLTPRQKQMCVQGGDGLAETLLEGSYSQFSRCILIKLSFFYCLKTAIRMSVYTCQQQFEYERWNCTPHGHSRMLTLKKGQIFVVITFCTHLKRNRNRRSLIWYVFIRFWGFFHHSIAFKSLQGNGGTVRLLSGWCRSRCCTRLCGRPTP